MSFIGDSVKTANQALARIWKGKEVPPFTKGQIMSRSRLTELAAWCNALSHGQVRLGTTPDFFIERGAAVWQIPDGTASPASTGSSGMVYCGLYSSGTDYAPNDVVYTEPDSSTRYPWVCEITNGPSSAVQAPTWPEPGTVYWRNLARSSGGSINMYRLKSVQGDYVTCRTWNGTTEGGSDIKIAKPFKLRESISSEDVFGTSHTYTYAGGPSSAVDGSGAAGSGNKVRTDNDGSTTEDQMVIPIWIQNDLIFATTAATGVLDGGVDVGLIMVADERKWAWPTPP